MQTSIGSIAISLVIVFEYNEACFMTVGEKIYMFRKQKGWSQEQLADKLSITRQTLSKWELNTSVPDTENVLKISILFNVTTDFLLKDEFGDAEEYARTINVSDTVEKFKLSKKAIQLLDDKGYVGAYYMSVKYAIGLVVAVFVCYANLSVLSNIAPLNDFPKQAFIIPVVALLIGIFLLIKAIIFFFVGYRLKRCKE